MIIYVWFGKTRVSKEIQKTTHFRLGNEMEPMINFKFSIVCDSQIFIFHYVFSKVVVTIYNLTHIWGLQFFHILAILLPAFFITAILEEFSSQIIWWWYFLCGRFFITNSNSLVVIYLFRCSTSSWVSFNTLRFSVHYI